MQGEHEIVEFLEGAEERVVYEGNYTITTRAFWADKPSIAVSVAAEGVSKELVSQVEGTIGNATSGSYWNGLLATFEGAPQMSLAATAESADIRVILTSAEQAEGKPGMTRLFVDKATGEIVRAEVYIYSADMAAQQGTLEYVMAHELGHALGLSHSTDPESMMHPLLEIEDGSIVNHIGSCESRGISALYTESRVGSEDC